MKVSRLKAAFAKFNEELKKGEESEQNFTDAVLADGTIVRWEGDLVEGVAIVKITEEGEVSLEDGQFTLEDGTMIEVAGGLVTSVTVAEMADEFDSEKFKEEILAAVDAKLNEFKEGFATNKDVEEMTSQLADKVQIMADSLIEAFEAKKPTTPTKTPIVDDKISRAVQMAAALRRKK
jgi:hypothetical protein